MRTRQIAKRGALGIGAVILLAALALALWGVPAPPTISASGGERVNWRTTAGFVRLASGFARDVTQPMGWMRDGDGVLVRSGLNFDPGILRAPGQEAEPISHVPSHAQPLRYRPGSSDGSLAYGLDEGGSERRILYWYDGSTQTTTAVTDAPAGLRVCCFDFAGERLAFSSNQRNGSDYDLYIWTVGGFPERLYEGQGLLSPAGWTPDGGALLVAATNSTTSRPLHLFDLETRRLERLLPDWGDEVVLWGMEFTSDGRYLYFTSDHEREFSGLWRYDMESGTVASLTDDLEWDIDRFEQTPDGSTIVLQVNEDGIRKLYTLDVDTGDRRPIEGAPGSIATFDIHPDRDLIVTSVVYELDLPEIHVYDLGAQVWSHWSGGGSYTSLPAVHIMRYPTFDSIDGALREIPAFLYPAAEGTSSPAPVLVDIHGGYSEQATIVSDPAASLLRERGVAVIKPNVRGSGGYGKTFTALDNGYLREDAVRDIGALLDWIDAQPELDGSRVAVTGGSYGGYMVLASMVHYSDRLACGINQFGISDPVAFLEQSTDFAPDFQRAEWGDERDPEMRAFLDSIAPIRRAHEISAPLLVYQGTNDSRVKAEQSRTVVETIRSGGGTVWYLEAANEGHGMEHPLNAIYTISAMVDFLTRCLRG